MDPAAVVASILGINHLQAEQVLEAVRLYCRRKPKPPKVEEGPLVVPPEFAGLTLYETDERFCRQWPDVYAALKQAFPGYDLVKKLHELHAWHVANPVRGPKINRAAWFVNRIRFDAERGRLTPAREEEGEGSWGKRTKRL